MQTSSGYIANLTISTLTTAYFNQINFVSDQRLGVSRDRRVGGGGGGGGVQGVIDCFPRFSDMI